MIHWPQSLSTWDLLFLIPLPWVGPVLGADAGGSYDDRLRADFALARRPPRASGHWPA